MTTESSVGFPSPEVVLSRPTIPISTFPTDLTLETTALLVEIWIVGHDRTISGDGNPTLDSVVMKMRADTTKQKIRRKYDEKCAKWFSGRLVD